MSTRWINDVTPDDVSGRNKSGKMLAYDRPGALKLARAIRHPWYRCQALAAVAEEEASARVRNALLLEAVAAAYEESEPNRIVSVATWPLRHLLKSNLPQAELLLPRLLATIADEPHGLRKLDGIARILHAVLPVAPLREHVLPTFEAAARASEGWRTQRIIAYAADALAEFDKPAAKAMLDARPVNKFSKRILAVHFASPIPR